MLLVIVTSTNKFKRKYLDYANTAAYLNIRCVLLLKVYTSIGQYTCARLVIWLSLSFQA